MGKRKGRGIAGLPNPSKQKRAAKLRGWIWWRSIGSPRYICAPMVDQSERAFRALCFKYNVALAYTPMLLADIIKRDPEYRKLYVEDDMARPRKKKGDAGDSDDDDDDDDDDDEDGGSSSSIAPTPSSAPAFVERPLIAQLGGSDVSSMVSAARWLETSGLPIDAIDINLGCPQSCAKRGSYGAFSSLEAAAHLVQSIDSALLRLPVTVKIRVLSAKGVKEEETVPADVARTVAYARRLAAAGASLVAVHGRTRAQKGRGQADEECIKAVVEALKDCGGRDGMGVPVVANGNIRTKADADRLISETGAAAAMSAEALLADPLLFVEGKDGTSSPSCFDIAEEYLLLASEPSLSPPPPISWSRAHVVALLKAPMLAHPAVATAVDAAASLDELLTAVKALEEATADDATLRRRTPPLRRRGTVAASASGGAGGISNSSAPVLASRLVVAPPISQTSSSFSSSSSRSAAPLSETPIPLSASEQSRLRAAQGRQERHKLKVARAAASRAKRDAAKPPDKNREKGDGK